ncbi:MAG: diaminopimelate decarboxylase [Chloroherpetonaceae bacterium]|nr:diaminopimelate decarboxylase [Chloroherpetonaceae bacterium]MDW8437755.1 diaminopimelate decarboxylase [Chloroherpetonaceae bacterium]
MPTDEFFYYKKDHLYCEDVKLADLAEKFGTPLYVTSKSSIVAQYRRFEKAFKPLNRLTCYSVKANYSLAVLRALAQEGCGFDVNSGGELFRALEAGAKPKKIIFAGVAKTRNEIEFALRSKVLFQKVESFSEMRAIDEAAKSLKTVAPIAIRVNPNVVAETHPYITTGNDEKKFGIDDALAEEALSLAATLKHVKLVGLAMHIGSQIFDAQAYLEALFKLLSVKALAESKGFDVKYLDVGGGFPITYRQTQPAPDIEVFAEKFIPLLKNQSAQIVFEPGRYIVGNASVILTEALYRKQNHRGKNFVIVDAAMTELMRPMLYEAYHDILPVERKEREIIIADVVGGACESGDFFALDREMPDVKEGELLAIFSAGAYGATMASNYNARPRAAEVMVSGKKAKLIRRRETYKQLIQNEEI